MATLCKNCGAPVVFDPVTQKVVCQTCGSSWEAEEIESSSKEYTKDTEAVSKEEILGIDDSLTNEYFDCYVYTCSSCGGEININGTEVSTKCIYCGSSSVVFSRISKEKAPEFIIPFQVSKEEALNSIKARFKRGIFIPKEIKNFEPTAVRGIYIPYWLTNAYHVEADVFSGQVKSGKHSVTRYWGRAGKMAVTNLPIDGSLMLSDESSQRLEPFDFSEVKLFDEDYLLGFYSNVSDIRNEDLRSTVEKRARSAFEEKAMKTFNASGKKLICSRSQTVIDRDLRYAMLPVWFITYDFNGRHNTIIVNGQTGKVVCGVPWHEKAFKTAVATLSSILTILLTVFFRYKVVPVLFRNATRRTSSGKRNNPAALILYAVIGGIVILAIGLAHYSKVKKQLQLTQSSSIFNFMKKRQG